MRWHSAAVVSSAEHFIRRQSRWSSGDKHHHTLIVEALCPFAAEPNHLFIISYLSFLWVVWLQKLLSDPPKNMCLWTTRTGQFFIFEDTHCFLRFLSPVQMVQILLVEFCEPKPPNVGFRKKKKKRLITSQNKGSTCASQHHHLIPCNRFHREFISVWFMPGVCAFESWCYSLEGGFMHRRGDFCSRQRFYMISFFRRS